MPIKGRYLRFRSGVRTRGHPSEDRPPTPGPEIHLAGNQVLQRLMRSRERVRISSPNEAEERRASDVADRLTDREQPPTDLLSSNPGTIRLHTGADSRAAARMMGARAFTVGQDIHVDTEAADPRTAEGQRVLAHEFAHATSSQTRAEPDTIWRDQSTGPVCEAQPTPPPQNACIQEDNAPTKQNALPDPGPSTLEFDGHTLAPRADYLRWVLAQIGAEQGHEAMEWYVVDVENGAAEADPMADDESALLIEIAPLLRNALTKLEADYQVFGDLVINAAIVRLTRNDYNLGLWSDYVASLAPREVMAMATAEEERKVLMAFLHSHAQGPDLPMDLYERRAWSKSRFEREYFERLGTGKIHGGCESCHEMMLAQNEEYASPTRGEAAIPLAVRMPAYARLNANTAPPSGALGWHDPRQPAVPDWAWDSFGDRPGTLAIAESLQKIRNYLLPLGDSGYRVISNEMLFDAQEPAELVAAVQAAIEARRQGYRDLIAEMQDPGYDFLEPLKALQALMPFADRDVRSIVAGELQHRQEVAEEEAEAGMVLGIVAALLTIFPPTAPLGLAIGAGLGLAGISAGYNEWQQGQRFEEGTGGGVFTGEQENAARMMQAMGIVNMTLGAINVVASGVEIVNVVRAPAAAATEIGEAADEVISVEAQAGGTKIRIDGLDEANPTVTVTQADGTVQQMTAGDAQIMAEPGVAAEMSAGDEVGPPAADEFDDFLQMLRDEGASGPVQAEGDITQLQPHAAATQNRTELGVSGRQVQSAHGAPQSAMRGVPGYDPDAALTRLMDRSTHTGMDQYWKQTFQAMRRSGQTQATAREVYDIVAESIRRAPGLAAGERNSLIARLSDEMFVEFGLSPTDTMTLPYPNIHP